MNIDVESPSPDLSGAGEKVISVLNKNRNLLDKCTLKRAIKLVARKRAEWVEPDKVIKLLITEWDREQLRKKIIKRAGRICYICGEYIPEDQYPTIDHVKPKNLLGEDIEENMRCCCKRCNDDKSDTPLKIYITRIRDYRKGYPWITADRLALLLKLYVEKGGE